MYSHTAEHIAIENAIFAHGRAAVHGASMCVSLCVSACPRVSVCRRRHFIAVIAQRRRRILRSPERNVWSRLATHVRTQYCHGMREHPSAHMRALACVSNLSRRRRRRRRRRRLRSRRRRRQRPLVYMVRAGIDIFICFARLSSRARARVIPFARSVRSVAHV